MALISSIYAKGLKNPKKRITQREKQKFAKRMRRHPTHLERRAWKVLKKHGFEQQRIIAGYIVDFVKWKAKVIVEIDGPHHHKQVSYDRFRDSVLRRKGYSVVHYRESDLEKLHETIRTVL